MAHIIQNTVTELETHPFIGSLLAVFHITIAAWIKMIDNGRINPLIMDMFQIVAWAIAIVCGLITILGFFKRLFKRLFKREKK